MSYNFDPERWYEDERRRLVARRDAREFDERQFVLLMDDLDRRYEAMLARLDGTFDVRAHSRSST